MQNNNVSTPSKKNIWYWILLAIVIILGIVAFILKPVKPSVSEIVSNPQQTGNSNTPQTTGNILTGTTTTGIDITAIVFKATGTEPFWSLDFNRGDAIYSSPDVKGDQLYKGFTIISSGDNKYVLENAEKMGITISANTAQNKCTDGMSDQEYDGFVDFKVSNNTTLYGCIKTNLFK